MRIRKIKLTANVYTDGTSTEVSIKTTIRGVSDANITLCETTFFATISANNDLVILTSSAFFCTTASAKAVIK